jgi:multidrug efflux pump subunit AcrB
MLPGSIRLCGASPCASVASATVGIACAFVHPLAIPASITALSLLGETVNVMTLGGLALAVGILVDDATVTRIETVMNKVERQLPRNSKIIIPVSAAAIAPSRITLETALNEHRLIANRRQV